MKFTKIDIDECYGYLIVTDEKNAILIDGKLDYGEYYLTILKEKKLNLKLILDTHTHADHLSAGAFLKEKTGARYLMGWNSKSKVAENILKEGDSFKVDDLEFKIIETPGHTEDSISIICEDKIFTGDFLFLDGTGRDDLKSGSSEEHYNSLEKLKNLESYLVVCPAHNYGAHELSSLHQVLKENPILKCKSLEEFKVMTKPDKEAPKWMNDIVELNVRGNSDLVDIAGKNEGAICQKGSGEKESLDSIPYIDKKTLDRLKKESEDIIILDVREKEEFKEIKPIEESIFITLKELPSRLKELEKYKGKKIISVCRSGVRAMKAAKLIKGFGIDKVFVLQGGIKEYRNI